MHLTPAFQKSFEKGGHRAKCCTNWLQSYFSHAQMHTVFHIFSSLPCMLLWVAAIFSDNRSTRLLPKPLWVVELHHTTKIIWHFVLRTGTLTNMVDSCSQASNQCLKKVCVSESFWCWTSQEDMYNLWKYENMTEKVVQLRLSCDGEGKSFLLGVLFVSKHLNRVQVKSVLGGSSSFQASSCSLQIRGGILFYIGLFWSWTTPPGHALSGIRNFREEWAQAAFFWLKGALPRPFRQFWRFFCRYKCHREQIKNTFHRFKSV